jgi:hypothetical protein
MRKYINLLFFTMLVVSGLHIAPDAYSAIRTSTSLSVATSPSRGGVVDQIMSVIGLKPNFELREANVSNAAAVVYNGKRYILYDRSFLLAVNSASKTDWAAISILAHEIGHHLNGHTLASHGSNPAEELEADEFSGFVLRKMGATLREAQAAMRTISSERDSHTHPGKSRRLNAIAMGWNNADQQLLASSATNSRKGEAVVRETPVYSEPESQVQHTQVAQPVLATQYILRDVYFHKAPHDKFYLTKKLNLVRVNENGLELIGKVKPTNTESFPYIVVDEYDQAQLYISYNGVMVNTYGKKVGYLSAHKEV